MSNVVCLMNVEADRATFTWSEGPASFEPYTLDGMVYKDFKEIAAEARQKLADLVKDYMYDESAMGKSAFALADAGHELYLSIFQPDAEQARQARQVRNWLEELAQQREVDTLEIVVESPWSLPWNIVYDQQPDKEAFLSRAESTDRWKPFWGLRYNLAGGRKVDPLRRMPRLDNPKVLMVVDPAIRDGLPDEQQQRLADFVESHQLKMVHSKDELQEAISAERPELLYWISHAEPEALVLAGEPISPRNMRKLLRQDDGENFGGLAFLNACQTAEGGASGSFFEAFHSVGFAGIIGTEHQTIDQFANPLGLDFLEAFLDHGEPVGSALRKLRGRVPLGLLYGTYCPPDIRVPSGSVRDSIDILHVHGAGIALGVGLTADETLTRPLPSLPIEPYRSLAFYERKDRALFAGRDDDIERFATYLDDASTRILVLHGESGVGKSSFLYAGVIPYLEEECLGYRFIREHSANTSAATLGSVIFIRATNDLFGQLAHALCEFCARPYEYQTPLGEQVSADLPGVLRELMGENVNQAIVRAMLRTEPSLLGRIMSAISNCLPFTSILVIDQGEEIFTLAQTPEDQQRGREALDMLRRTVHASGGFKVIFSLRTEYYGRVIDRLRRGLHNASSIREYLLTDFDEESLVEAIRRPTIDEQIPYSSDIPFERYGFRYAGGVAEEIAHDLIRHTTQRRDSVLPLMQVICAQLYRMARRRDGNTISREDFANLGGFEGGMRSHVEGLLGELLKGHPLSRRPVQKLFTQLYLKQPDGTLTTALLPEDEVEKRWTGRMPFDELLSKSLAMRLLKVNTLRIGFEEERRYVSLGHDALAKLAADWDEELSAGARTRKMAIAIAGVSIVGLVMTMLAIWAVIESGQAKDSEKKAVAAQQEIEQTLARDLLERIHTIPDEIGRNEFLGFWQIASLPPEQEHLRTLVLKIGLENADGEAATRLANRAPYVAQSLVGLDSGRRERFLNELIKPGLQQIDAAPSVRLACVRLGIALKLNDVEFAEQAVKVLSVELVRNKEAGLHDALADDLDVAVRLFGADDSQRAVIPVIEAMQMTVDAQVMQRLCSAVNAAPGEITQSQGRQIANRLFTVMEQEIRAHVIHDLSHSLKSIPSEFDIVDVNRAVNYVVQKITETGNRKIHDNLVKAFVQIAARLRPSECQQAKDIIIEAMFKPVAESQGSESVQVFAQCLTAVASRLAQSDRAQGIEMLLSAMQTTEEADPLRTLSAGLSQLPGELTESDDRAAIARLLEMMQGTTSSRTLRVLAESLTLFPDTLSDTDLAKATAKLLSEMREDRLPPDIAELSKGLAALPLNLSSQDCLPTANMLIDRLESADNRRLIDFFSEALKLLAGKMTPAASEAVVEPILLAMTESRDAEKILAMVRSLRGMDREGKSLLRAAKVSNAYHIVLDKMRELVLPIELGLLAESLAELPGDTPEDVANEAIKLLLSTLESTENLDAVGFLVDGLGAVGGDLSADVGHQAVRQIVDRINLTADTALWRVLSLGLAAVSIELEQAGKFTDADAADVVTNMAWAMDVTTDNTKLRMMAEALVLIAPKLSQDQDRTMREAVGQILATMQSTHDPAVIATLARGWEALAARMTEPETRDAFDQFLAMVKDPANASARSSLTQGALALVQLSSSSLVMDSLDRLLSAMQHDHHPMVLETFLGGIDQLASRVASSDVDQAIARIIAFNAEQTLINDQVMNGLVQALDALPGEIETRELIELLKSPFCTGAARQSLLKMIEKQTSLNFDGNPWNFVAQAEEAGIDPQVFRETVQRPFARNNNLFEKP